MKILITAFFVNLVAFLTAQNWSPILVNEKMNYQHSASSYISHTIWVDSVETNGDNLIYYLNRIVKDVPDNPEIVLRNQPQFLLKQMTDQNLGYYIFNNPGEFVIKSLAGIGDGWVFNQQSFILAEVSSIAQEDVLGVQDSVKVISLTDGNEIRLSKNFGILNFPDFENGGNYELVGIQDTEYGESVPDFWDIFDFEVGDVFQMVESAGTYDGSGIITRKITITSFQINANLISYDFDGIYNCIYFNAGGGGGVDSYTYTDNYNFLDSIGHPSNMYSNQIFNLPYSYSGYGTGRVFTRAKIGLDSTFSIVTKEYGMKQEYYWLDIYMNDVFYEIEELKDTLYRYDYVSTLGQPGGLKGIGYGGSLGLTFSNEGFFEYWSEKKLVGFIKNGDTIGTITPDSLLLVGIFKPNKGNQSVTIFPNPADKTVNFEFSPMCSNSTGTIEIMNLLGEVTVSEEVNGSEIITLDIGNLKRGIYFYSIIENGLVILKDKLIVQ